MDVARWHFVMTQDGEVLERCIVKYAGVLEAASMHGWVKATLNTSGGELWVTGHACSILARGCKSVVLLEWVKKGRIGFGNPNTLEWMEYGVEGEFGVDGDFISPSDRMVDSGFCMGGSILKIHQGMKVVGRKMWLLGKHNNSNILNSQKDFTTLTKRQSNYKMRRKA
ncbi:hypothetical protein HPP92_006564 [Vanilla planifolia]|uniref:Uncharacterized protein n=1 Tax=Vanilla planifolia TaxID=51239 RepID=A0A835VE87_VANPL|nr:hypothetical protein HPP92_006564 [Vanilla planifolia]